MSESERRRGYRRNGVLIETARILSPEFADAVVYLTGAQIEMLRNVTQYLNRQDTYVDEYNPGYYLTPNVADYDDILEIVADLEETLMGNPNTIWGYADRWHQHKHIVSVGGAQTDVDTTPVPAGYVYKLEQWCYIQTSGAPRSCLLAIAGETGNPVLSEAPALSSSIFVYGSSNITLKEGDYIKLIVYGLPNGEAAIMRVWGHMMVVPE